MAECFGPIAEKNGKESHVLACLRFMLRCFWLWSRVYERASIGLHPFSMPLFHRYVLRGVFDAYSHLRLAIEPFLRACIHSAQLEGDIPKLLNFDSPNRTSDFLTPAEDWAEFAKAMKKAGPSFRMV